MRSYRETKNYDQALEQFQAYQIATANKPWMLPSEVRSRLHMPIDMTLDEAGAPAPAMEQIGVTQ